MRFWRRLSVANFIADARIATSTGEIRLSVELTFTVFMLQQRRLDLQWRPRRQFKCEPLQHYYRAPEVTLPVVGRAAAAAATTASDSIRSHLIESNFLTCAPFVGSLRWAIIALLTGWPVTTSGAAAATAT